MLAISIKVLSNRLPGAALKLRQQSGQVTRDSAFRLRDRAKQEAPVDTGLLRSEIEAIKAGAFDWDVVSPTFYAGFVHNGTSRQSPNPYLFRASIAERPAFLDAFDAMLDRLL